jgi:CRP/FNR family cyclic AMP-dependent transcriptional regulator
LAKPRKPSTEDLSRYAATAKAGEFIFREGDLTSDLYILEEGRVELIRQDGGSSRVVATLGPGELFGELALLEDQPRDLTARAVEDATLLKFDYATLIDLIRENPQIALHGMRRLSRRLRDQEKALVSAPSRGSTASRAAAGAAGAAPAGAASGEGPAADGFAIAAATPSISGSGDPLFAAASRPLVAPRLVHLKSGTAFPFASAEAVIGRGDKTSGTAPEIDLSELDRQRTTSRRHAVVFTRGEKAFVREEPGVSNGTFVNGRRIKSGTEVALQEGDRVRFGLVELVVRGSE